MKYVLDTNAVSALMRGDTRALDRLGRLSKDSVTVPQPVFAEIAYGIERLAPSRRRRFLASRLALLRAELARAIWTDEVSDRFGAVKATLEKRGAPLEDFDIAIASHALAAGAVLVTANRKHMERIAELSVEDWIGG